MRKTTKTKTYLRLMREQYGVEQLDEIVYLIVEVLCSKAQYFTISGEELRGARSRTEKQPGRSSRTSGMK